MNERKGGESTGASYCINESEAIVIAEIIDYSSYAQKAGIPQMCIETPRVSFLKAYHRYVNNAFVHMSISYTENTSSHRYALPSRHALCDRSATLFHMASQSHSEG